MLFFSLGKKSQEDGSYNIMSVVPLILGRPYQEPKPWRIQQQKKKAHFEHFKTREDTQLDTVKEDTIFLFIHFKPIRCSLWDYFHIPLWSEAACVIQTIL